MVGLNQLDGVLVELGSRLPVCLERSEGLLVERLPANGHRVFAVNPRIAARARERYRVARSKDDVFDAFALADTLRHEHGHWRSLPVASAALAEVRALSRDRDRLLESQQRVEAQLLAVLDAYHPAPAALFSSIDRDITLAFIADYPTPQAAPASGSNAWPFCRRQSYRGRVDPGVLTQRLKDNLLTGAAGTVAGKSHSALVFAELLGLLNQQLADYEDAPRARPRQAPGRAHLPELPGGRDAHREHPARRDRGEPRLLPGRRPVVGRGRPGARH